jgi:PAS domain-containing protein
VIVKFVNTDGMAFIGPGSEWFWTAVSGVVLGVTFIAIYRQLRLARASSAREQLETSNRDWNTEWFARCKLEVLTALRDGPDPAGIPGATALAIAGYWERIGALAQGGHIDAKLLHAYNGGACPVWWVALAPYIKRLRSTRNDPTEYLAFERLSGVMAELDRRAGADVFTEASLARQLQERIGVLEDRLRFEQALRAAMATAPDPVTVARPAPPAQPVPPTAAAESTTAS